MTPSYEERIMAVVELAFDDACSENDLSHEQTLDTKSDLYNRIDGIVLEWMEEVK